MYLVKTPKVIQKLFPNFVWSLPTDERVLYLTFDDGPIPDITPWVLDQLAAFNARATFFCVGQNISRHPEIFQQLLDGGHAVGNHTNSHLDGWATDNLPYFHDVRHCAHLVNSEFFRPPYGHLRQRQAQFLQRHYQIIMWDVLSGDFDASISPEQCLKNTTQNAEAGSIIVFHDSIKAKDNLRYALPRTLKYFTEQGFRFETIAEGLSSQYQPNAKSA